MRVSRFSILLFAAALTVAGCAQQPVVRYQLVAAPAANGIDNVVYGSGAPAYRPAAAAPVYAAPQPQPAYAAAAPAPTYVAPQPYRTVVAPGPVAPTAGYGGAPVVPAAYAPPMMAPQPAYTLDSGDRLRVVVFGQDGLTNSYLVDASGRIAMPLIGVVPARGLTADQLSERIAGMLRQGFIREPHVAVEVEAYRPFFILGEVAQPGQYPYVANMTVETAVAIAGGFGPRGFRRSVTISRNLNGQLVRFETPITAAVRPGDTIQVQERWF
jgi:polysaccharide export outer membrane protein